MWQQKSFQNEESKGILYLVPTPIGNLEDMSFRAVRILKEMDFIAAEDTRNTKKLCHYFEIDTPLMSHHEHNKDVSGEKIVKLLKNGAKIALVSDAGMPAISDPGYELVKKATEEQLTVVSLPGANAALTALIASGLATQPFYFYGFLSRHKKEKRKELEELGKQTATLLIYEAPHRLKDTLQLMAEVLGERKIVLCRELTKKYEELIRGTIAEAMDWANREEVRGEFCLVVEGGSESASDQQLWWDRLTIKEHIEHYISEGMAPKDAIKQTAKDRNIQKRDVYHVYHIES